MSELMDLTPRQQEIYAFISRKIETRGFPPTIRDIGTAFDIKSPNGVMCHLKALEKKGFITREGKSARAIRVNHKSSPNAELLPPSAPVGIPFKGLVAAGSPLPASEQDERVDLHELLGGPDRFVLQVRGQSMIENHIADGDYVVIRNQETAQNGERVVAVIDGEYTLKRFYRKKDHIRLEPENGAMEAIIVDPTRDIRLIGVLVGVVRKC